MSEAELASALGRLIDAVRNRDLAEIRFDLEYLPDSGEQEAIFRAVTRMLQRTVQHN